MSPSQTIKYSFFAAILAGPLLMAAPVYAQAPAPTPFSIPNTASLAPVNQESQAILEAAQNTQAYQGLSGAAVPRQPAMSQADLERALKEKDSPTYKAHQLAKQSKRESDVFSLAVSQEDDPDFLTAGPVPRPMEDLQKIRRTHGGENDISDDLITEEIALDMRKEAQREAALSYGARGALAKRSYEIMEDLSSHQAVLDGTFNFRALLVKAPSGLLIEPPIVREALDALIITQGGSEAAVADQVLKINKQAKIVTAPRDWRQYIATYYQAEVKPPPRILWPKNHAEQKDWNGWVRQGWAAGLLQAEEAFNMNLGRLVSDYNGMVRYRVLLAEGKISQPYTMHEDRGVTGGRSEMRVGDRALRLTGPSQFLTGSDTWKPANR